MRIELPYIYKAFINNNNFIDRICIFRECLGCNDETYRGVADSAHVKYNMENIAWLNSQSNMVFLKLFRDIMR